MEAFTSIFFVLLAPHCGKFWHLPVNLGFTNFRAFR